MERTKSVSYAGIVLDQASSDLVLSKYSKKDWRPYAHHCTLCLGPLPNKDLVGSEVTIIGNAVGETEGAVALSVILPKDMIEAGDFKTSKRKPHVTVCVAPGHKPAESNKIKTWKLIPRLILRGVVEEI